MKKLFLLILLFACQYVAAQDCSLSFDYSNLAVEDKSTKGWDTEMLKNAEQEFIKQYNKAKPKFKLSDNSSNNKLVIHILSIRTGSYLVSAMSKMEVTFTVGGKVHKFDITSKSRKTEAVSYTPNLRVMSSFGYAAVDVCKALNKIK